MGKEKLYQCPVCEKFFSKLNSLQKFCSPRCSYQAMKMKMQSMPVKAFRNNKKLKNQGNNLVVATQNAVNAYVRARDENKECISCGTPLVGKRHGGGFDAGHYRSVGSAPHLRFYTLNIHGQCRRCNLWESGNHDQYRIGLIERLGNEKVEAIEADQRERHYTDEQLKRLVRIFNKKTKRLEKKRGY